MVRRKHLNKNALSGFTLIEVMVASSIGMMLMLVVYSFLFQSTRLAESMVSRVQLNNEARLMFRMASEGGFSTSSLAGIYGSGAVSTLGVMSPSNNVLQQNTQRLELINIASGRSILSTELDVPVTCTAANVPHPDCTAAGVIRMNGYLSGNPSVGIATRSLIITRHCTQAVPIRTATSEMSVSLTDPHLMGAKDEYTTDQISGSYRNAFSMHVDCW